MNRIGCDIDGCLADFNQAFINLIVKETGVDLFPPRPFDIPTWHYPQLYGYTNKDHLNKVWDIIGESETFWQTLQPYPETLEAIMQLYGRILAGDDVYFITTRPSKNNPSAKHQTERWLMNQTIGQLSVWADFYPTVLVTGDKGPIAKALNLTHFIDDKKENCIDVALASTSTKIYLLDRPWNRLGDNLFGAIRIGSVLDMLKEIN